MIFKGKNPHEEHGASNLNNEDGNEAVPMEDDTVQAAEHSCYVIHHSYGQEPSVDHAGCQRISSPSVEIRGDSPAPQSVHEEGAITHQNAIVAYQTPEYKGEPLSMFERQVLYRLDAMTAEQRAYFEITQARFQHLDDQIEGVQLQLVELYYKDYKYLVFHTFLLSVYIFVMLNNLCLFSGLLWLCFYFIFLYA